ncbi:MAG: hypothetical protein ACREFO_11130 [Acetobacteraceae bacterium]
MTEAETATGSPPEGPKEAQAAAERAPPEASRGSPRAVPAWLGIIGFLVLAAGIIIVWRNPRVPVVSDSAAITALGVRLDQLSAGLQTTETKLAAAEATLAHLPAPPDLGPIEARLSALEKRPVAPAPAPAAGLPNSAEIDAALAPLAERLDALEKSEATLKHDLAAVEQKVATTAPLAERIGRLEQSEAAFKNGLAAIERRLAVTAAAVALEQGRPLGELRDAPPALARFAKTAPPTLAGLRTAFDEAATAERAAARPSGAGQPLTKRLMDRLGDLLTVREGNQVIIGNPAEPALISAKAALTTGDVAGAVKALAALPGQPAPAMAQWMDQAKALLAARAAMAQFAGGD